MVRKLRGTGVRHTLPFVGRFAGLWMLVTSAAVLVAAVSTYLVFAQQHEGASIGRVLAMQTVFTILAVGALAVFTTHRLAGPWIAVRRALEAVRDGNLDDRLRIRTQDVHIKGVEHAFNEMLESLQRRGGAAPPAPRAASVSPPLAP
jgi:nitrogen fixation/metabolism regulation signal transduction histidine kinase